VRKLISFPIVLLALVLFAGAARPAFAQPHHGPPGPVRGPVVGPGGTHVSIGIGVGIGYPCCGGYYRPYWGPYWGPGPYWYGSLWYPFAGPYPYYGYPYYPYYPYGYPYDPVSSSVKLQVKPQNAEVYVDGYRAGTVDDFDGIWQRLRVRPGEHELTLYANGFHTETQHVTFAQASDQTIKLAMEPLAPGEVSGPRPVPTAPPPKESREQGPPQRGEYGRQQGPPRQPGERPLPETFGTLSIRTVPGDAEVLVDGERWTTTSGQERLNIQLADGRHQLEVRKEGYESFTSEIQIRHGQTNTLNISLPKR